MLGVRRSMWRRGRRAPRAGWFVAAIALALVAASTLTPGGAQVAPQTPACRITAADAFFYADTPRGDLVTYYANVMMYTDGCGVSPAEVQATFRPVAGLPSTCNFKGTLLSEYAMCQGAQGVAASGTPVVVEAIGRTYGSAGADLFSSSCTLVVTSLPPGDGGGTSGSRASCPLPVE